MRFEWHGEETSPYTSLPPHSRTSYINATVRQWIFANDSKFIQHILETMEIQDCTFVWRNPGRLESSEITSMFRRLSHAHTPFLLFQVSQRKMKGNYANMFFEMVACTVVFAFAEGNLEVLRDRYSSVTCWDRRAACHENPLTLSSSDGNLREVWTKRGRGMTLLCGEYEKGKRFHPKQW